MKSVIDLNKGLTYPEHPEKSKFFKELKKMLKVLNVSYHDECCNDTFYPYIHTQTSTNTVWTIAHNLGYNPEVISITDAGTVIVGTISYVDVNNLTITFGGTQTGIAKLK